MSHYDFVRQKLDHFLTLKDDWDSYGALKIESLVTDFAAGFYLRLEYCAGIQGVVLDKPFVVPTCYGGVQFEWFTDDCFLEIEILVDRGFEFLIGFGGAEREGICDFDQAIVMIMFCHVQNAIKARVDNDVNG